MTRRPGHASGTEEIRNAREILVGNLETIPLKARV
jgi:hypothetical protein